MVTVLVIATSVKYGWSPVLRRCSGVGLSEEKIVLDWSKIFFSGTKINRSSLNLKMQQQATGGAKWVKEGSPNENADRC